MCFRRGFSTSLSLSLPSPLRQLEALVERSRGRTTSTRRRRVGNARRPETLVVVPTRVDPWVGCGLYRFPSPCHHRWYRRLAVAVNVITRPRTFAAPLETANVLNLRVSILRSLSTLPSRKRRSLIGGSTPQRLSEFLPSTNFDSRRSIYPGNERGSAVFSTL